MLELKNTLKNLRQVQGEPAVSVFIPTHRTFPDNEQDSIALKNQLKTLEERLTAEHDKRTVKAVLDQIDTEIKHLNHNYNLDTLAIFATPEQAQLIRLPFDVEERVIIDKQYSTRDFIRMLSHSVSYYILVITSEKARLIEAYDDRLVKEITEDSERQQSSTELNFPIMNTSLPTGSKADPTGASDDDKYLKEFLNRVDKSLQQFYKIDPMPVVLVGDGQNLGAYEKVCDKANIIIGKVDNLTNLSDAEPQSFVDGVQEVITNLRTERFDAAKQELEKARDARMVRTDLQMIYRSAREGNAVTLLVRQGHTVPAIIDEENNTLLVTDEPTGENVTDDAVAEIIEIISNNGGDIVFMPVDLMDDKEPIALITRY